MELEGKRGNKEIIIKDETLWKKREIAVLAYFSLNRNHPATYRDISRAYVSSSYSNYQKACESLRERGYLKRLKTGEYKVTEENWEIVKTGKEVIVRPLPYFKIYLEKLKMRETP